MIASIERLTGLEWKNQGTVFLVGLGHAGTHWIIGSIYVLLPFIQRDLQLSYTAIGALFTIFHLSAFVANFASGLLVDVTGRRVVLMMASLSLGAVAFMACGWAVEMSFLMAMMTLIGATNNLWHPPAISFLSRLYPNSRGYALSIHAFGASFGDIVAPLAMGVLLLGLTWQSTAKISALPVFLVACQRCRLSAETRRRRALWVASEYIPDVILVFEFQAYLCWFGVWRPQGFRRMDCEAMHRLASEARQGSPEGCFSVR